MGGILLSLSYTIAWFPWSDEGNFLGGLHFLFALCLYDTALTFIEVNYASLLADVTHNESVRTWCNSCASLFSILGCSTSYFAACTWEEGKNLIGFRWFCASVSVIVLPFFYTTFQLVPFYGSRVKKLTHSTSPTVNVAVAETVDDLSKDKDAKSVHLSFKVFLKQLSLQSNFKWFSGIQLLQCTQCTFEKNHLALFLLYLIGNTLTPEVLGGLISLSFILPHVSILLITPLVSTFGLYSIVRALLLLKWCASMAMLLLVLSSQQVLHWAVIVVFLCGLRIVTETICRLMPLVRSELVDEDCYLHKRKQSMAASIIGTSSMFAKPGESIAPILGWYILSVVAAPSVAELTSPGVVSDDVLLVSGNVGLLEQASTGLCRFANAYVLSF
jgi:Na+/melibiose symporter-like transporter